MSITIPSSDIEFSPGSDLNSIKLEYSAAKPKNIVLFIADGMGFSHLSLAMHANQSKNEPSVWNEFEIKGWHDARSYYGPLTDSEASATAIATGTATNFGHIGIDKDGKALKSLFEMASDLQYTTGIVTDSYIWDGTPAAFVAHTRNEDDARDILTQIAESKLNLIFGELEDLGEDDVPEKDETLEILSRRFQLLNRSLEIPIGDNLSKPIAAIFNEDEVQDVSSTPNLTQLTQV
ncbi:MAG: alkaline phosphatase, partial [Maribacter sp.]|nr:alkaline phosphatase [Maribacter sp.]